MLPKEGAIRIIENKLIVLIYLKFAELYGVAKFAWILKSSFKKM